MRPRYPDIPTALSEPETIALQQLADGKRVLEIGSLLGYSTVSMALTAELVVSVDPHTGYPVDNPRDTWAEFNENLVRFGVADNVSAYRELYEAGLAERIAEDEGPADFVFIDADGTYDTTVKLIELAAQNMHVEAPILAVHDYGLLDWPGAGTAVRDYCTQAGTNFGLIDTLALIRVPHPDD